MEPDENQKEIHKLTHEILEKKNKLEELFGKKLVYESISRNCRLFLPKIQTNTVC